MAAPITAGGYLRLRRQAAGLTIGDVVNIMSPDTIDDRFGFTVVALVEIGGLIPYAGYLKRLRTAYRFDPYIVGQLWASVGSPRICRVCGCTDLDACDADEHGNWAWSPDVPNLCTHCVTRAATADDAPALLHA